MLIGIIVTLFIFFILITLLKWFLRRSKRKNAIGIFHLYCSSGGGGERVLWHMIKIILEKYPGYTIYIYTHKHIDSDPLQILVKARNLFKIDLLSDDRVFERIEFVPLSWSPTVEAKKYPFLTLFLQNLMSIFVAIQAAYNLVPEVYIETIGFTFTLPVFKLLGCTVLTYVHYPTISPDMIQNVLTSKHASYNNRAIFVRSSFLRRTKLVYYKMLASLYGYAGRCADLVMANSRWTQDHLMNLWCTDVVVVNPPCDVESFKTLDLDRFNIHDTQTLNIISVAQFRPEKNHELQIEAFDSFLSKSRSYNSTLTLYGGCRDKEDEKRVEYLRDLVHRLDLVSRVNITVNAPFEKLLEGINEADVAIHTMENEHFGIVLVEFMAAGLITVAHNSGGPKKEIIKNGKDGLLANNLEDFTNKLLQIHKMSSSERLTLRRSARNKSDSFSVQAFEVSLIKQVDKYLGNIGVKKHSKAHS